MSLSILRSLLLPAFLLEVSLLTLLRAEYGIHPSAFLFLGVSLFIGLAGIGTAFLITDAALQPVRPIPPVKKVMGGFFVLLGILLSQNLLNKIIQTTPIDVKYSDIIPLVAKMANRFLNGEFVYAVINDWGYELYPTYLTLQWLPFSLAELLNMDYRWFGYTVFIGAIITFSIFTLRRNITLERYTLLILLPFIMFLLLAKIEPVVFGVTVETLVIGYYLLMVLSIFSKSNLVRALGLLVCLLSRYALVVWIPLYILIVFFVKSKRNAIIISAICAAGVLLLYILPFMTVDANIFSNAHKAYHGAAVGEWSGQGWQQPGEKPYQLFRGIGLSGFMYDNIFGDIVNKVNIAQRTHLVVSVLITVLLGLFYYKFKSKLNYRVFLLGSLKVYLAFFYSLIQVPYNYLFLSMIIVSLPILAIAMISPSTTQPSSA
jgi:hypothetical protein